MQSDTIDSDEVRYLSNPEKIYSRGGLPPMTPFRTWMVKGLTGPMRNSPASFEGSRWYPLSHRKLKHA